MKTVVYVDVLLLVNFLVGYFLLRSTGMICACALPFGRNIGGAALAAASSLLILLPPLPFWLQILTKALCGGIIVRAAFPYRGLRTFAQMIFWYTALNLALAGMLIFLLMNGCLPGTQSNNLSFYFAISPPVLFWSAAGVYFALRIAALLLPQIHRRTECVKLQISDTELCLQTLCDTGFSLREPISGQPVLLVSFPAVKNKMPQEYAAFLGRWFQSGMAEPPKSARFRLVPMGTAAGRTILPAFILSALISDSVVQKVPAAFSPQEFRSGNWDALAAPELLQ